MHARQRNTLRHVVPPLLALLMLALLTTSIDDSGDLPAPTSTPGPLVNGVRP